jgi:hypothetical protein
MRQWRLLNADEYAKENRARCIYTPDEEIPNSTKKFASFLTLYMAGTPLEN